MAKILLSTLVSEVIPIKPKRSEIRRDSTGSDYQMNGKSDIQALEEFINDNPELERLEEIAEDFNIFTALGIVDTEIRHSNFLAWLIDPNESHGLGDYFLASFLKKLASKASSFGLESPSVFDIDSWHFDSAEILREWRRIDILIRYDEHKFVCVIENKIRSGEHSKQLQRYREIIQNEFPDYSRLLIYLTIDGEIPSDDDYMPLSYGEILPLIDHVIESKRDKIGSEILTFISHYREMLRRYIMEDSEVQEICRQIYKSHKRALDLIFEYKPDKQLEIYECLVDIIEKDPDLILDEASSKSYIRFISRDLDFVPKEGVYSKSGRMLLFDTYNGSEGVIMYLSIRPGPQEIRQQLYEIAREDLSLFGMARRKLTDQFTAIYKKSILKPRDYEDIDAEELREILASKLNDFKNTDLPKIVGKLSVFQHSGE